MSAETTSPAPKEALRVDPLFALSLGEAAVLIEMIDDPTSPVRGVDGREDAGYNIHVLSIPRTAEELADWPEDEKVIPHIVLAVIDTREHQDFATEIPPTAALDAVEHPMRYQPRKLQAAA